MSATANSSLMGLDPRKAKSVCNQSLSQPWSKKQQKPQEYDCPMSCMSATSKADGLQLKRAERSVHPVSICTGKESCRCNLRHGDLPDEKLSSHASGGRTPQAAAGWRPPVLWSSSPSLPATTLAAHGSRRHVPFHPLQHSNANSHLIIKLCNMHAQVHTGIYGTGCSYLLLPSSPH